jgi:hypothetical protein
VTELERRIDALDERSSGGGPDPRT